MNRHTRMNRPTRLTQARYDRIAPVYDAMEWAVERLAVGGWRSDLWARVPRGHILEVGVGTGENMPYYPAGATVTAIDASERMLARARRRARALHADWVDLRAMDAQHLAFADATFDAAVATFVFCSIRASVRALRELARVVRHGGDIWLLEHVRVSRPWVGRAMDSLHPVVVRAMDAKISRDTVSDVLDAGLQLLEVEVASVKGELVKRIRARSPEARAIVGLL